MQRLTLGQLEPNLQALARAARDAAACAHAPYSKFRVGAALLCEDGRVVTGANYESASYGLTICAERAALARANMEAHGARIAAIAVYAHAADPAAPIAPAIDFVMPCGACRQLIAEAAARSGNPDLPVICLHPDSDDVLLAPISWLLPKPFIH